MHTDEAVHAIKFGELLENNSYKYDPIEYHGPTLNYFTLVSAAIGGKHNLKQINEYTLRLVPAITSLLLIISLLLLLNKYNTKFILLTALLFSASPVLQFYSRYYIQEVLLVTFSYVSIFTFYKFFKTKKIIWSVISGLLVGLTFSTKETSIIIFFSAIVALIILSFIYVDFRKKIIITPLNLSLVFLTALVISILFYSSFLSNPKGIIDSITTFGHYFNKANTNQNHIYPWYYYLKLMLYTNNHLIFYSSIPIFIFSILGFYFSFSHNIKIGNGYFFKFVAIFSFTQAIIYSFISYKTPWLVLNFWVGFLIIAALGIYYTYKSIRKRTIKNMFTILITMVLFHNVYQLYITSFKYPYQPENPFTYSQPTDNIIVISNKIINVVKTLPKGNDTFVNIIAKDNDYWPLPWYLRKLNNVAWNNKVPDTIFNFPIILSTPNFENELIEKLYTLPPAGKKNLYIPLFSEYLEIRPGIEMRGYIQKDFYDTYLRTSNKTNFNKP